MIKEVSGETEITWVKIGAASALRPSGFGIEIGSVGDVRQII